MRARSLKMIVAARLYAREKRWNITPTVMMSRRRPAKLWKTISGRASWQSLKNGSSTPNPMVIIVSIDKYKASL